jgi:hypothetical protein
LLAALIAALLVAVPGAGAPAWAAASGPRAALIVEVGQAVRRLCVGLGQPAVSGKALVEISGLDQRWDGGALCRLAGTGPAGGDCFAQYPRFWGYWIGDGRGGWTWSDAGAAATTVRDGSVQAWVRSAGADESSHRRPPALRFADACAPDGPAPGATAAGAGATGQSGAGAARDQSGGQSAGGGQGQAGQGQAGQGQAGQGQAGQGQAGQAQAGQGRAGAGGGTTAASGQAAPTARSGGGAWASLLGGGAALLAAVGLVALAWRRRRQA